MKRPSTLAALIALPLALGSCATLQRTLQVPLRMIDAGKRTITGSVEDPGAVKSAVALRSSTPAAATTPILIVTCLEEQ